MGGILHTYTMYFECIYSLFPLQFFLNFSLLILLSTLCLSSPSLSSSSTSSSFPFLLFFLLLPFCLISAAHKGISVWGHTGEQQSVSQGMCTLRKTDSPPSRGGASRDPPSFLATTLTGLILCTFCTGSHRCGEFMSTMGLFVSRRHCFATVLPELLLWSSFHPLFCETSWALWGGFGIIINDYYLLMMIAV